MAAGDPYFECSGTGKKLTQVSDLLEIFNALLTVDNTGKKGFRYVTASVAAGNLDPVVACGQPLMGWEELIQNVIVETASGEPAIRLIAES